LYKQTYPRDVTPYVNLAVTYVLSLGEFEKGLENAKEAIRVDPDEARGYDFSARAYLALNRVDEAKTILKAGLQRNPSFVYLHDNLASIAFVQGDTVAMDREEAFLHGQPDLELGVQTRRGDIAVSRGQLRQALDFYEKARQTAQRLQLKGSEAGLLMGQGWILGHFGYSKQAIEAANSGLAISQIYLTRLLAANALVLAGENKRALELAAQVARERPDDTLNQTVYVPWVQAVAALNGGSPKKTIELLNPASQYDKANTADIYVRGLAYLKMGQGKEAEQEFEKILALHNFAATDLLLPLAHLGAGRAYALSGDTAKAKSAYQDFFALWKDADPDIPILKEAKAEYAKLQ
jgi:tetratricopeptide (TPR) repeat protein